MKNTKMKYKIFFLMVLFLISLNNVNAEINTGVIESAVLSDTEVLLSHTTVGSTTELNALYIDSGAEVAGLNSINLLMDYSRWTGSTASFGKSDVTYRQGASTVGTGYIYFWARSTDSNPDFEEVYIKCFFDDGLNVGNGKQIVFIDGAVTSSIQTTYKKEALVTSMTYTDKFVGMGYCYEPSPLVFELFTYESHTKIWKTFYNKYNWWYNEPGELFEFNITRDVVNSSMIQIFNNGNIELINETSLQTSSIPIVSDDLTNSTWIFTATDNNDIEYSRTFNFIPEIEDITSTLTTDKILYNTSEQITISFTNIDEIEGYVGKSLSLYILYPIIDDYKDYDAKYMLHLYADRRDETFTLNTSFLSPQNEYHLAICEDADFHQIDDGIIISDTFYVYSDDEYLNTNCDPSGNCYTYNGGDISIYYKINNNSNIIIKDNEGNTIQTYYNIIGENELNYNIPEDLNKLNFYPNWKIYLNNTEYETNYSTDVTVYWSLIATPTPTPIYTSVPIDENVSKQIDELKGESKPIFDLIYGLSELVIDNPDYDDDNIITENEMNNWFNSLIPIILILLIFIVYTGLTKKR